MTQMATSPKRRTREATEARRALILEAAIGLFGERGYYGFTIQELGKRCGLSNPGLLHYFPSKQDVLLQVLKELEVREAEFMEPLVQRATREVAGHRSREAVLTILRAMIARATSRPEIVRLMAEIQIESLNPSHPAHDWWQMRDEGSRQFFTDLLRPHVKYPEIAARHLLALMDGLCAQWLRAYPTLSAVVEWDHALARFLPELHADKA